MNTINLPLIKQFSNMRNRAFNFPVHSWILKLALINLLFISCHKSQVWKDFRMFLDLSLSICVVVRSLPAANNKRAADAGDWYTAGNINQLKMVELCHFIPVQDQVKMVDPWWYLHVGEAQLLSPRLYFHSLNSFSLSKNKNKNFQTTSAMVHLAPSSSSFPNCESAKV